MSLFVFEEVISEFLKTLSDYRLLYLMFGLSLCGSSIATFFQYRKDRCIFVLGLFLLIPFFIIGVCLLILWFDFFFEFVI